MDVSQFLNIIQIPDPEAHRAAARHLQTWHAQHQEFKQQLANGHSQLTSSWQGSASDQYQALHNQMQQLQEEHQQQRQQAAELHLGVAVLLEAAKIAQDLAIAQLVAVGVEVVAGFFTFGITDALAAPEIAGAVETEAVAQGQAMAAKLMIQRGFTMLFELFQAWQKYRALLQLTGAGAGAVSGVVYGVQHHESLPEILLHTTMDAATGYGAGSLLGSGNPVTVLKTLTGMGYGSEQVLTGNANNEDPFAVIAGDAQMLGSTNSQFTKNAGSMMSHIRADEEKLSTDKTAVGKILQDAKALGWDPAKGKFNQSEADIAMRLQQDPEVGPLTRDKTGQLDWFDENGRSYDGVGPVPTEHFNLTSFLASFDRHLYKKQGLDFVVADLTGLNAEQHAAVMAHIDGLPSAQRARIKILGE